MSKKPKQLIDKKELTKLVKYSSQHIARLEKAGEFPKRLQLGQNRVAWILAKVEEWIDQRIAKRDRFDQLSGQSGSS